jgi:hypothetical protein
LFDIQKVEKWLASFCNPHGTILCNDFCFQIKKVDMFQFCLKTATILGLFKLCDILQCIVMSTKTKLPEYRFNLKKNLLTKKCHLLYVMIKYFKMSSKFSIRKPQWAKIPPIKIAMEVSLFVNGKLKIMIPARWNGYLPKG